MGHLAGHGRRICLRCGLTWLADGHGHVCEFGSSFLLGPRVRRRRRFAGEQGASAVEYGALVGFILAIVTVFATAFATALEETIQAPVVRESTSVSRPEGVRLH